MYSLEEVTNATLEYFNGDELATNVFITKYCLKNNDGDFMELTPDDMHHRLAKEFARIEAKFDMFGIDSLSEEHIYNRLKNFEQIVPQGSPMFGIGNEYVKASLSNCVVVESPADSVSSIVDSGKELANLFKRRCGVGLDLSNLRPENTTVSNAAGTTTGAWSFADFYSYICRMIGQNGRRGALMITMDIRHPDIEKFITMKKDLSKVTGANVSVRITDDFMKAVENDDEFNLHFPCGVDDPSIIKRIRARKLWSVLVECARDTAEPGMLMWDNIISTLPAHCYPDFKTISTNPCGELPLSAGDSCRLITINLKNFVKFPFTKNAFFDFESFNKVVNDGMRLSDDLVELELEKLRTIKASCDMPDEALLWSKLEDACMKGRRTGLGTHGLADCLARLNLQYDSHKAIEFIDDLYEQFKEEAYYASCNLAKERGSFPVFNWELEKNNIFIQSLSEKLQNEIATYGRRNISLLTNAPTGSVSILSQTSSGIEPVFRNSYIRRRKLSHNEQNLEADFIDEMGDKWLEYKVFHHNLMEYFQLFQTNKIPNVFIESDNIDWSKRVDVQATIQRHIDHSISSTINLPSDVDVETVKELYLLAWKKGLKGVTVYRDGSRSGVLITEKEKIIEDDFPQHNAPKRPEELVCDIHHMNVKGEQWVVFVGLVAGKPYELIGGLSDRIELPSTYETGVITKRSFKTKNNAYDLTIGKNGDTFKIKDLVQIFDNPNHSALTRLVSLSLRHGAKVNYVVEQLQKEKDSDMFSFAKCLARVLKKYIKDNDAVSGAYCPTCSTKSLLYQEGCKTCKNCGYSACG